MVFSVETCPEGWVGRGEFCYLIVREYRTWQEDASNHCKHKGGNLASFHSKEENDFIWSKFLLTIKVFALKWYNTFLYNNKNDKLKNFPLKVTSDMEHAPFNLYTQPLKLKKTLKQISKQKTFNLQPRRTTNATPSCQEHRATPKSYPDHIIHYYKSQVNTYHFYSDRFSHIQCTIKWI